MAKAKTTKTAVKTEKPKMITSLTPEQEALFPSHTKKWLDIGLATGPAVHDKCIEFASAAYVEAGLKPPKEFEFLRSPLEGARFASKRFEISASDALEHMCYGSQDASWLAFYDYMLSVLNIEECARLKPLMNLATVCGWWAPYEDICIFQDRPTRIEMQENVLHSRTGPAIEYADGFSVYAWKGTRVPKEAHALAARVAAADLSLEDAISVDGGTSVTLKIEDKSVEIDDAVISVMNKFGDMDGIRRAMLMRAQ